MSPGVQWVAVSERDDDAAVEISTEPDGTLLLSSVTAQFPGCTGLRFRKSATSKALRGVRCHEGVLHPPSEEDGWGQDVVYLCVMPKVEEEHRSR